MPIVFLLSATKIATGSLEFGFSRGFAIRSLAGLIDAAGLPARRRALKEEEMLQIYEDYRDGKTIDQPHYGNRPVNFELPRRLGQRWRISFR